jgi:hypothetical protein
MMLKGELLEFPLVLLVEVMINLLRSSLFVCGIYRKPLCCMWRIANALVVEVRIFGFDYQIPLNLSQVKFNL